MPVVFAAAIMTYIPIQPILAFWRRGWEIKRNDIFGSLGNTAKAKYFATFQKENTAPNNVAQAFSELYHFRYGRYRLIAPISILTLTLVALTLLIAETALNHLDPASYPSTKNFFVLPDRAIAALTGAYIWVVAALIADSSKYTLPPALLLNATLRLIAAVPVGYAVGSIVSDKSSVLLVCFIIGAFPLQTVQIILQRWATKKLGLDLSPNSSTETTDQVTLLDGVDALTADRLQAADITTIAQLAYCDPIQLSMRTNYTFSTIIDLVDQALAWIYLGDKLKDTRPFGIRGAMAVANLYDDMRSNKAGQKNPADAAFKAIAAAVKLDENGLKRGFEEIGEDPHVIFLNCLWEDGM